MTLAVRSRFQNGAGPVPVRSRVAILSVVIALHVGLFLLFYLGAHNGGAFVRSQGTAHGLNLFRLTDASATSGLRTGGDARSDRAGAAGAPPAMGRQGIVREKGQGSGEKAGDAVLGDALAAALADDPLAGAGWASYQEVLRRHIAQYRRAPMPGDERAQFGTAVIRVNIDRDGRIIDARVLATRGASLDEAALDALWRAEPLPAVPSRLTAPLSVDVSIEFVRR